MNSKIDIFPEINHELMTPLRALDDYQISQRWENEPHKYRYLLAIFFRYHPISKNIKLEPHHQVIIEQYCVLFWFFAFDKLLLFLPAQKYNLEVTLRLLIEEFCSQERIVNTQTAEIKAPSDEQIRYLPMEYFLNKALDQLYPLERIIIVSKDNFSWSDEKILQYLEEQKQSITLSELQAYYTQAHSRLINALPTDIVTIYLNNN